jgi:hypothetical protein
MSLIQHWPRPVLARDYLPDTYGYDQLGCCGALPRYQHATDAFSLSIDLEQDFCQGPVRAIRDATYWVIREDTARRMRGRPW